MRKPPLIKPVVNNAINNWLAGFLNHQQWECMVDIPMPSILWVWYIDIYTFGLNPWYMQAFSICKPSSYFPGTETTKKSLACGFQCLLQYHKDRLSTLYAGERRAKNFPIFVEITRRAQKPSYKWSYNPFK